MKTLEEYKQKLNDVNITITTLQANRVQSRDMAEINRIDCAINNELQKKIFYENWIQMLRPMDAPPVEPEWEFLPQSYAGAPERRAQLKPMPPGPYCHISQFDQEQFMLNPYSFSIKIEKEFSLQHGCVTFAVGPNYKPIKVGFWYDTSD